MSTSKHFIALAGNPNSGKTTAFNWYTGARQHVGNYPGITVEKKEGYINIDDRRIDLIDLPGIYSLTAYSMEEVVARKVLAEEKPAAVLNIINSAVLERNLYLTVQIRELGTPVVLALNMMDEAKAKGLNIDIDKLEKLMGIKAVATVARTGSGLKEALLEACKSSNKIWEPLVISYGIDIDESLLRMIPVIEDAQILSGTYPARWLALKFLESDQEVIAQVENISKAVASELSDIATQVATHLKTTLNTYPEAVIADYRYGYIASILRQGVISNIETTRKRIDNSDKADQFLTNRFFGPLTLLAILYAMYYVTFELGAYPANLLAAGFEWLNGIIDVQMSEGHLKSLIMSGAIDGVGGVLGFVPLIMIMFLFISILEDSGYMARVAYMMDRIFRIFGLHGASIMPFVVSGGIAGGCAIPGIMAARTLRSPRERLATILTAPFMACGAKLPVFLLFVGIFFQQHQALIMFLITVIGWLAALLVAKLLRSTVIKGEATPFIMELPPYRLPTLNGVLIHTWERTWMYIKKAGTIILAISVLIWAGMTFPGLSEEKVEEFENQRSIVQIHLDDFASFKISTEIDELKNLLLEENDPTLQSKLEVLEVKYAQMPFAILSGKIEELNALVKNAEENGDAEAINEFKAELKKAQKSFDALPEVELLTQVADLNNEEASTALRYSYAGRLGIALEGISAPAGFDWRTNIALVGGIAAKEVVVSTLGTAYSLGNVGDEDENSTLANRIMADPNWTLANAVAIILFTLLYSPCFPALVVIKQESGKWRWMFFSLFFNLGLAYSVAVAANQIISKL